MMTTFAMAGVALVGVFLVSERESLGLRVKNHLPSNPALRLFLLPWLPGGGRGTLWLLLTLVMVCTWGTTMLEGTTFFASSVIGGTRPSGTMSAVDLTKMAIWATGAYAVIYLLLPTAVFSNRSGGLKRSALTRGLIPALFVGGLIVPPLVGFVTGDGELAQGRHLGNPFVMVDRIERGAETATMILLIASIVLGLQLARVMRGIVEVIRAPQAGAMASGDSGVTIERVPSAEASPDAEQDA